MMSTVASVVFGLSTMSLGAVGAVWFARRCFRREATRIRTDDRHAAKVLAHLQELALRMTFDVDRHNDRVKEIGGALVLADQQEPKMIAEVVTQLIRTNQEMQEKLAATEDKLRQQAREIKTHAAEARTDPLTLLANRRAFDDELARRCAEFKRQGRAFSMIMSDVDLFKNVNDKYGHATGDEVLRGMARVLRRKMREMDLVARYGGEEFAIILPGTHLGDAETAALRACEGAERSRFKHNGNELGVTMSFGVAEVQDRDDGPGLLARADDALYAAKKGGRNCVYVHDGETIRQTLSKKRAAPLQAEMQRPAASAAAAPMAVEATSPRPACRDVDSRFTRVVPRNLYDHSDLPTRAVFCRQARCQTAKWKRGGPVFCVILIEVDQYCIDSGIRIQHAHRAAMQATGRYLAAAAHEADMIAQYAPGCFAMLLPTLELADAIGAAERIRKGFPQANCGAEDQQSGLRLSVGIAQIMDRDDSITLLMRAEEALDAAARRGGGQSFCHDGEQCAPVTAMIEAMDYLA